MSNIRYSYILLPDFSYRAEDLPLGTLISKDGSTHLPDPSLPLVEASKLVQPDEHDVRTELEEPKDEPWSYVGSLKKGKSAGFSFELPFISPVHIGLDLARSKENAIKVECRRVLTKWFRPSRKFLAAAMRDDSVQDFTRGFLRPAVFMVTGVKIAEDVMFEVSRGLVQNATGDFGVDFTSLGKLDPWKTRVWRVSDCEMRTGAPVKLGPRGSRSGDAQGMVRSAFPGPLVLAYQLKAIKLKGDDAPVTKDYIKNAVLFSDEVPVIPSLESDDFVDDFDIQDVEPQVET